MIANRRKIPPMKHAGVALIIVGMLALAGCGNSSKPKPVDKAALVAAIGGTQGPALDHLIDLTRAHECKASKTDDEYEIAAALDDNNTAFAAKERLIISYVCPDKLSTWDAASS